jgi:hypothetical protein
MQVKSDCISCQIERAKYECDITFKDKEEEEKIFALIEFLAFLVAHLDENAKQRPTPAFFGTERERIIKRRSGTADPHIEVKRRSTEVAKRLLPRAKAFYEVAEDKDKITALLRIAAAANSMEYGVKGYTYDDDLFKKEFVHTLTEELFCDVPSITAAIEKYENILYITDNAGEIIFDAFVIKKLREKGKKVVVSPKKQPVINDATVEDLIEAKTLIADLDTSLEVDIIPCGSSIGISLGEAEENFVNVLRDTKYLVIAKGMGNYEAMSAFEEDAGLGLKGRLIYVFRAKCQPVADDVGVKRGVLVAKLV